MRANGIVKPLLINRDGNRFISVGTGGGEGGDKDTGKRGRVQGSGGVYDFEDVKTKASHRKYPLTEETRQVFMELQKAAREKCNNSKYVFSWRADDPFRKEGIEVGTPFRPDHIGKLFNKMAEAYKKETGIILKGFSIHGLRRSCASILFARGWSLEQVRDWLGQDDSSVTKNFYIFTTNDEWKQKKTKELDILFHQRP